MTTTGKFATAIFASAMLLAGCGGGSAKTAAKSTTTSTTTPPTVASPATKTGKHASKSGKAGKAKKSKAKMLRQYVGTKADVEATAAPVLGLDVAGLDNELSSGKTLADIAIEHHVDLPKLTDALTTAANQRIVAAKTKGSLPDAQAQEVGQRLPQAIGKLEHRSFAAEGHAGSSSGTGSASPDGTGTQS